MLTAPRNQHVPIRLVNLDPSPVTVYKNTKIATAELITDKAVCSTCEGEQPSADHDVQLHPIPHDITKSQKEQFLALMSHYSCVIAKSPNDLGHTQVMKHHIDTNGAAPI